MVEKWWENGGKMVDNGGKWWKNTKLGCSKMPTSGWLPSGYVLT
jgi:hypothetical protein